MGGEFGRVASWRVESVAGDNLGEWSIWKSGESGKVVSEKEWRIWVDGESGWVECWRVENMGGESG